MRHIELTKEERDLLVHIAHDTYQTIGHDVWGNRTPSQAEYSDVMLDQMWSLPHAQPPATDAQRRLWQSLPRAMRRRIVLAVGP